MFENVCVCECVKRLCVCVREKYTVYMFTINTYLFLLCQVAGGSRGDIFMVEMIWIEPCH